MLKIKSFLFNPIMENTYLLYDESHEGVVIDPGNVSEMEDETLSDFIGKENITIKYVLNTHPHVDHTYGNDFCKRHFHAELLMSEAGLSVYRYAPHYCVAFGLDAPDFPEADRFVSEGDEIVFGHHKFTVIENPGHTSGCLSFYCQTENVVFTGDCLFKGSVGRTDFPTGDVNALMHSISEKLLVLPENTVVYPGHGDFTTIGEEKRNCLFIKH